jgi:hypothetical protein
MKKFLSGLLIAGALLLAGCSGVLDESAQPASSGTTGTVLVQIGSPAAARTLTPDASGIVKYIVKYAPAASGTDAGSGPWTVVDVAATSHEATVNGTPIELEPGRWAFEAIGYADDTPTEKNRAVATGSTTVTVEKGKVATAAILLSTKGDTNVPGYFKYNVDWTALGNYRTASDGYLTGVSGLTLTLTRNEDISGFDNVGEVVRDLLHDINLTNPPTHTNVTGTIELPSGVYDMDIALTVSGGASIDSEPTVAHRTEVVYIYSYLDTLATYTFTDLDVQKLYLTGPKPWLTVNNSHATYEALSFELYTRENGTLIPFYRTNAGTTTETTYSLTSINLELGTPTSTWEVYIPGYAVASDVTTGTTTVAMKTVYSGLTAPVWTTLSIDSKQGSVYDHDTSGFNNDLDVVGRNVKVIPMTSVIPGAATAIANPELRNDGKSFNAADSATGTAVVIGKTVDVSAFIGTSSEYKVSYIEVQEVDNPDVVLSVSSLFNPTLSSDTSGREVWNFTVPMPSGSISSTNEDITVTVHYFHTGDVVRGKHTGIDSNDPNAETKYTIAYVNRDDGSGGIDPIAYEFAGSNNLKSIVVLDAPNTSTYSALTAYNNSWTDGFDLTTIDELGKVLAQSRINPIPITSSSRFESARYWSKTQRATLTNLYYWTGSNYSGPIYRNVYLYKDNAIQGHRTAGPTSSNTIDLWPSPPNNFGVAYSGGGSYYSNNSGANQVELLDANPLILTAQFEGYVQLVKTVNIPPNP